VGALTGLLQREFARLCPPGWKVRPEGKLLPEPLADLLGYSARADVVMEKSDGSTRLWIEFEVSRADPVANHSKFATSHLFQPQLPQDRFLAMVSPHITRGRRNLASNTIALMRLVGMKAYQTVLLPHLSPQEVQRLNQLTPTELLREGVSVTQEIERVLAVTEPITSVSDCDVLPVGELLGVFLNLRQWNLDMAEEEARRLWGRRTVTYFVHDPKSGDFAPSKFCAYAAIPTQFSPTAQGQGNPALGTMTVSFYVSVNDSSHLLDGNKAQRHLTTGLHMRSVKAGDVPEVDALFEDWRQQHADCINIHQNGPTFLLPPDWFS
jgi:hypothetical protein